jgi:hypothetical protein
MKGPASRSRRREDGQILVLFALSAVAIMAAVGLVLDGGGAFAQRRVEQNGADLASLAGANVYMNTSGNAAARTAAAIGAARAAATRNGYTDGVDGATVGVTVTLLASGADVKVDLTKPHKNSFSSIIPGQSQWDVSVTATAVAGTIDTAVGAAPWTMSIDAFNTDGTPKYTSSNPHDFNETNNDYPINATDISWTDFNGFNNVNAEEVKDIVRGDRVITATFFTDQYLGQHNNGNMTTVYPVVDANLAGTTIPIPIVGPGPCDPNGQVNGCFKGWAMFYVISATGGSSKVINGYFTTDFKSQPLTVGVCTPQQQAAGQCGEIKMGPLDNRVVRLTN